MNPAVEDHRDELEAICRRFAVRRLELFGSAAGDRFDAQASDLDFLVEFDPTPGRRADRYFGLLEALEEADRPAGRCDRDPGDPEPVFPASNRGLADRAPCRLRR